MTQARIYLRISRPDEKEILENQRVNALDHVAKMELHLAAPPYEETASGGNQGRAEFNRLISDAKAGEIIVFTSLSRMTRGGVGAAWDILRSLEARKIGWHFVEQPVLNHDANTPKFAKDVILAVLAAVDEDYRRRISEATRAAYARRKALSEATDTPLLWGKRGPEKRVPPVTTEGIAP